MARKIETKQHGIGRSGFKRTTLGRKDSYVSVMTKGFIFFLCIFPLGLY